MEFIIQNIAPIMFVGLILFLLSGFPITFSLAATGICFAVIGISLGIFDPHRLQSFPLRIFQNALMNDTLLAIPFFTFMGLILERSGMAEDLLDTIGQLFGPIRGGLAYAVILVGGLLAATTGVVAASVIAMGLISLPLMLKYGYDKRVASGTIAASGTLAQIIPPSLVLIILASQLNKPVGELYKAAFVPGILLMLFYMIYILIVSIIKPSWVPALPSEARTFKRTTKGHSGALSLVVILTLAAATFYAFYQYITQPVAQGQFILGAVNQEESYNRALIVALAVAIALPFSIAKLHSTLNLKFLSHMAERVIFVLVPPLALIFLVLGTVGLGIATPTEGGGLGALGAILLAWSKGRLDLKLTRQAMDSTIKLTSFVIFILIGSSVFNLVFQELKGDKWVEHLLTSIPGGVLGFLIVINILFFVLAFFLEFFELSFILVPLIVPVANTLGVDLVWLGVLLAVNMQTSFMHPPFGFALIYLRSVAPKTIKTSDIYMGAIPFVMIQLVMVALIIAVPSIVPTEQSRAKTKALESGMTTPAPVSNSLNLELNNTVQATPSLDLTPSNAPIQPAEPKVENKPQSAKNSKEPQLDFIPAK